MTAGQAYRDGDGAGRWFAEHNTTPSEANPEPVTVEDMRRTAATRLEANDITVELGFTLRRMVKTTRRAIGLPPDTRLTPEGDRFLQSVERYREHATTLPPGQSGADQRAESFLAAIRAAADAQDAALEELELAPEPEPLPVDAEYARGFYHGVVDYCDLQR